MRRTLDSILGLLLFNIFLCDFFFGEKSTDCSLCRLYHPLLWYTYSGTTKAVSENLQEILKNFFQGFSLNRHVANADKFHLQTGFKASKTLDLPIEMKETCS